MSNVVVISGKISDYGPKLRYLDSGKPELNFTLCSEEPGRDGQVYTTYVPVVVYGSQCKALAESLEPHDVVLVMGKLSWVKKTTKDGEKAGLAVTTFDVEVLVKAEVPVGVTDDLEPHPESELPIEPPVKVRRPRTPKIAQQPWIASRLNSDN